MPGSLPCTFSDAQVDYILSLSDDLGLITAALNTLDVEGWRRWVPLARGVAGWSSHVREHHGVEVAFRAELMLLMAQAAPFVHEWEFPEVKRLYEPIEGFWRV